MTKITASRASAAALTALLFASGCAFEAGSQLNTADFGNATMNNHLVQTCRAGPTTASGKFIAKTGACPGRTWDGRYAQGTYDAYVNDAAPIPPVIRNFE
ncbi:MAG: hypothetical protein AAF865_06175 [Pseudomonadota bacterium]